MEEEIIRNYNVEWQDLTPFVGSFIYMNRNWKKARKAGRYPEPYEEYNSIGCALTLLDGITGIIIALGATAGLAELLK